MSIGSYRRKAQRSGVTVTAILSAAATNAAVQAVLAEHS
jgi:hypothetical protein